MAYQCRCSCTKTNGRNKDSNGVVNELLNPDDINIIVPESVTKLEHVTKSSDKDSCGVDDTHQDLQDEVIDRSDEEIFDNAPPTNATSKWQIIRTTRTDSID